MLLWAPFVFGLHFDKPCAMESQIGGWDTTVCFSPTSQYSICYSIHSVLYKCNKLNYSVKYAETMNLQY